MSTEVETDTDARYDESKRLVFRRVYEHSWLVGSGGAKCHFLIANAISLCRFCEEQLKY